MPAALIFFLLHGRAVHGYTGLTLKPCDQSDRHQLWDFGTRGLGRGDSIKHQESQLCLMARDCGTAEGTELVLDSCAATCLADKTPPKAMFTMHHAGGSAPRGLEWDLAPGMFVYAESDDDPLVLKAWDSDKALEHQTWVTAVDGAPTMQYLGQDHTLQVGHERVLCLGAHHEVVPDGDGGWLFDILVCLGCVLYLAGGVGYSKVRHSATRTDVRAQCCGKL